MTHYISLIRKLDFADLYKYGFLYINRDLSQPFSGCLDELSNSEETFRALFQCANSFDYTLSYVLIHYSKRNTETMPINIEDVNDVIALDSDSYKDLVYSFGKHLIVRKPIWESYIHKFQVVREVASHREGAVNVWKILHIEKRIDAYASLIEDELAEGIISNVMHNKRPSGNLSLWGYLLQYERHEYYPQDSRGYFLDCIHVFMNYLSKHEVESIDGTDTYKYIMSLSNRSNFGDTLHKIKESKECTQLQVLLKKEVKDLDYLELAPLFMLLKSYFREGFYLAKTIEDVLYHAKSFGESFYYAIYLLGFALGYDKSYDCLYDTIKLPILRITKQNKQEAPVCMSTTDGEVDTSKNIVIERVDEETTRQVEDNGIKPSDKDSEKVIEPESGTLAKQENIDEKPTKLAVDNTLSPNDNGESGNEGIVLYKAYKERLAAIRWVKNKHKEQLFGLLDQYGPCERLLIEFRKCMGIGDGKIKDVKAALKNVNEPTLGL